MPHKDKEVNRAYKREWYRKNRPASVKCRTCKIVKNRGDMSLVNECNDYRRNICKICDATAARGWYRKNKDKKKDYDLKRKYGIGLEQYNCTLLNQGGVCAICKNHELSPIKIGETQQLAVDHNHRTGRIRGLLCFNCNKGLGSFMDNPQLLKIALEYLLEHT